MMGIILLAILIGAPLLTALVPLVQLIALIIGGNEHGGEG